MTDAAELERPAPPRDQRVAEPRQWPARAGMTTRFARVVEIRGASSPPPTSADRPALCRSAAWQDLIEQSFQHRATYVAGSSGGRTLEILPFFLVRSPLGGPRLVSTPYQGFAGGFESEDPVVRRSMLREVEHLAAELRVRYVEIRHLGELAELREAGYVETSPALIACVPLTSPDDNWCRLAPSHRRNVRMAAKRGVTIEPAASASDMLAFHASLSRHYQQLGVPFLGERFFAHVWETLVERGSARLLLARQASEVIGGLLLLLSGRTLVVKYGVTRHDGEYAHVNASYALYWEAIREGLAAGCADLNLGITGEDHSGLRAFKNGFGAVEERARFYYRVFRGRIPDYASLYRSTPLARRLWRGIPPPVAVALGSRINRWIC